MFDTVTYILVVNSHLIFHKNISHIWIWKYITGYQWTHHVKLYYYSSNSFRSIIFENFKFLKNASSSGSRAWIIHSVHLIMWYELTFWPEGSSPAWKILRGRWSFHMSEKEKKSWMWLWTTDKIAWKIEGKFLIAFRNKCPYRFLLTTFCF